MKKIDVHVLYCVSLELSILKQKSYPLDGITFTGYHFISATSDKNLKIESHKSVLFYSISENW